MRWVAIFQDSPGMTAIRTKKNFSKHLEYLRRYPKEILIAGGLREAPDRDIVGGLWVMEVRSRQRAAQLVEKDPYFSFGFRTYRLLTWAKALADTEVTL